MARRVRVRGTRRQVWNGSRHHTNSGHNKSHLMKNKSGKVVTKKSHAAGRRAYKNIRGWTQAVSKARKALGITGFCAVKKGTALYKKAREFYCATVNCENTLISRYQFSQSRSHLRSTTKCLPELAYGRSI